MSTKVVLTGNSVVFCGLLFCGRLSLFFYKNLNSPYIRRASVLHQAPGKEKKCETEVEMNNREAQRLEVG